MKKYYGVINAYYDNGKISSYIIEEMHLETPLPSYIETKKADIYCDWFTTYEAAKQYHNDTLKA